MSNMVRKLNKRIAKKMNDTPGWDHAINKPIHQHEFKDAMMRTIHQLNPDFWFGPKMKEGFLMMASSYNNCIKNNRKHNPLQIIVPPATGSGKTVSAKLALSMSEELNFSGLLVVSQVDTALEAVNDINKWAGKSIAKAYYSVNEIHPKTDDWCELTELPRVGVITHALFRNRSETEKQLHEIKTFNGKQRDLIIVDEGIYLMQSTSFGTYEIRGTVGTLMRDNRLEPLCKQLRDLNDLIFKTSSYGRYIQEEKAVEFHQNISQMCFKFAADLKSGKYQLINRTRGSLKKRQQMAAIERSNAANLLYRIGRVVSGTYYHSPDRGDTICHTQSDLNSKFGATIVLNATANINPDGEYRQRQGGNVLTLAEIKSRNYKNVTLNICKRKDARQSKSAIYVKPLEIKCLEKVAKAYCRVLMEILEPNDKILVVSYKKMMPIFAEHNPDSERIKFVHWGSRDVKGSNEFKDFNKVVVIGWLRKKEFYYNSLILSMTEDMDDYIPTHGSLWADIMHMKNMQIIEDIIQVINRIRCRTASDPLGNCRPCDIFLFTGGSEIMEELIPTCLAKKMPNLQITDWIPRVNFKLPVKKTPIEDRAIRVVEFILLKAATQEEVTVKEVIAECGLNSGKMKRLLESDIFHELLDESGILYIGSKGRGKPSCFILG